MNCQPFTETNDFFLQDGYEFFANRKLVTIFSAPHYCGQFDNAAAMMNVDESLVCTFQVLIFPLNHKVKIVSNFID